MADVGHFRSESGQVIGLDLPLPKIMQDKVTKGYLTRVNADGSSYPEPDDEGQEPEVTRPAHSAAKAEWVGYAVRAHGMTPDDAEALTKADLIERFGGTS